MKINEKTMYAFACSRPVDREGFLSKRGEGKLNLKKFQLIFLILIKLCSKQSLSKALVRIKRKSAVLL